MTRQVFDTVAHARTMRADGFWLDRTVDEDLVEAIARTPDKPALVAHRADRASSQRFTYRELGDRVSNAAGALRALGVGRGDVVTVQLPNWREFAVTALACGRLGAVVNPLMPIFRERELSYMLGFAEAKVLVVPKLFRGFDHEAMAAAMRAELPGLQQVVVVDGAGDNGFDRRLLHGASRVEAAACAEASALRPDELAVMMFTSGTTGSPKGVMHSSNTLIACTNSLSGRFGLDADDVLLACSPLGHMTGYAAGLVLGIRLGATIVLQDVWHGKRGVTLMAAEGVTYTAASTPFLSDICEAVTAGSPRPDRLRSFLCGGAPIPPVLIERAARELDLKVCSLPNGQIVALLGSNGAGKTTTLKAASGVLPYEKGRVAAGRIRFFGDDIAGRASYQLARAGLAHVREGRHIFGDLTVEENLVAAGNALAGGQRGRSDKGDTEKVFSYFPRLRERRKQVAGYFSGGEQQMLAAGRAIIGKPRLILLDEPSLGLAPLVVKDIFSIIERINREDGVAMLLVEQNAHVALGVAHYGYIMENGRIVINGPTDKLLDDPDVQRFYLGGGDAGEGHVSFRDVKHYKRRKRWLS